MNKPLFALKSELDMLTDQVYQLKRSYDLLDSIAEIVHTIETELTILSEQMRRLEKEQGNQSERFSRLEERLKPLSYVMELIPNFQLEQATQSLRLRRLEESFEQFEKDVSRRFSSIEANLQLIVKHLGLA